MVCSFCLQVDMLTRGGRRTTVHIKDVDTDDRTRVQGAIAHVLKQAYGET